MNNRYLHGVLGFDHLEKVYLEMDKGDTVFFHPLLMHGSGPNLTNGFRRSISVHYANSDCYFIDVGDTAQNLLRKQLDTMMFKLVGYGYYDTFKFNSKIIHGPFGKFQQVQNKL
ncbi:phytanoyl-CoA dioxygenase, peroxisomal-like isoform X1 [Onthophagus taurus]|uniref:phytanoyl-CoA dioxygenase, peroxisomal-like isoform X1 n=2 Tax=Onthophagus taurus TaxID=166361 RepID=UPI0039BE9FBA